MAFKTREQRAALRAAETAYTVTDHTHFRGKTMRRGTVDIKMDERIVTGGLSDRAFRATTERDGKTQAIDIVFLGQRAKDFKNGALLADMERERQARIAAGNYDCEDISRRMIVEGFWKARNWKDGKGVWHKAWEFFASNWHFILPGSVSVIEEGARPEV